MPITLPSVSLAGVSQGQTGTLNLSPASGDAGVSYAVLGQQVLRLHNESQCGLQCSLNTSGQSFYLPAGGWTDCYPKGGDNALSYTILYVLANPGVTLLLATLYYPGDQIPAMPILGNSPIGGGTVSNQFNQLINTGQPPLTSVIGIQPSDASTATWTADNSGNLTIKGDNAGTLTTLLQLIAGASPQVILAAAGILTKTLGSIDVEGQISLGGIQILAKGSDTELAAPGAGNLIRFSFPLGTTEHTLDAAGDFTMSNVHIKNVNWQVIGDDGGNTVVGNGSVNTFVKAATQTQFQVAGADTFDVISTGPSIPSGKHYNFIVGTLSRQNGAVTACGSGTVISHGLGVTPAFVLAVCNIAQPGSATVGVGSVGSSTFTATITAGSQIDWWAASG